MDAQSNTSTITSSDLAQWPERLFRALVNLAGLIFLWIAVLALGVLIVPQAQNMIAIGSGSLMLARLNPDTRLLRYGERRLVVHSKRPGLASELYSAGAWLVLPALSPGCLDLRTNRIVTQARP